jgi:hypothetical protein
VSGQLSVTWDTKSVSHTYTCVAQQTALLCQVPFHYNKAKVLYKTHSLLLLIAVHVFALKNWGMSTTLC